MKNIEKRASRANVPERTEEGTFFTPLVDIVETGNEFLFLADVPGVKPGDVEVNFDNGVLSIDAKVQPRQKLEQSYVWQEYGVGRFHREFTINTPVKIEEIKAELKNGELMLHLPKAEEAKTRRIAIQSV